MDIKTAIQIGDRINTALAYRNKKQLELADYLHVQPNIISYFCSGKRTPNTMQIIEIAKFLNVSTDYLLGLVNAPTCDTELKAVCQYIGCSQEIVEFLKSHPEIDIELLKKYYEIRNPLNEIINKLI